MERLIRNQKRRGFTLLELLIVVGILGLVTGIALPSYRDYVDQTNNALAATGVAQIDQAMHTYWTDMNVYPTTLAEIGMDDMLDPWGNAYILYTFDETTQKADKRKDKKLNPVNQFFDLYSMGKDGKTARNFSSKDGADDIVRCNDGRYIGLADDYL